MHAFSKGHGSAYVIACVYVTRMHCRALGDMLIKTVNHGEGNSALVIGSPGSGKNLVRVNPRLFLPCYVPLQ